MNPDFIHRQTHVPRVKHYVWNWNKGIIAFLEDFLNNPEVNHLYDWGTEHLPYFNEDDIPSTSLNQCPRNPRGHTMNDLADRCEQLFLDRPDLRQNLRAITGTLTTSHQQDWMQRLRDIVEITPMFNYLWYRDSVRALSNTTLWNIHQDQRHNPRRLFQCLMHHVKPHRLITLDILIKTGLINTGHDLTRGGVLDPETHTPSVVSFANSEVAWQYMLEIYDRIPEEFRDFMPYARRFFPDGTYVASGLAREQSSDFYSECLIDIVVETTSECDFFTEKTFKPIFYGKPFVVLGSLGQNTRLRELGFETFTEFFDLTTDDEHDHDEIGAMSGMIHPKLDVWRIYRAHFEKILKPLADISHTSPELPRLRTPEVQEKCIHNQARLVEIMFDDNVIAPECWDARQDDRPFISHVHPGIIERTRNLYAQHEYFKKFVPNSRGT